MTPRQDLSNHERQPLLENGHVDHGGRDADVRELLEFGPDDEENPHAWSNRKKMINVFFVSLMAFLGPLASSIFNPGIEEIAKGLHTDTQSVVACTTGFVIFLGIGPLVLAPFSETFGRRNLYLICYSFFTLLQIPAALAPNVETLIAIRAITGFFGSVGVANGGGSLSDMFEPGERATVFGWYLFGPVGSLALGPIIGGVVVERLDWRWIFGILAIVSAASTTGAFFFLRESYAPVLLARRKQRLQKSGGSSKYVVAGQDTRTLHIKLATSLYRPLRILCQPIILTMSAYQALSFATSFSIFTNMQNIYQGEYGFNNEQVGLMYLGPGIGFLLGILFLVPRIDTVYSKLASNNQGTGIPEYRLPLANVGSICLPISLFWFAWTVDQHAPWWLTILGTPIYGLGQVAILNCTTNYYIDAFEKYAASAIAAGAFLRSLIGGLVPLFVPDLIDQVGYGWTISIFGFVAVVLAPAPLIFYHYGGALREKYRVDL